MAVAIEKIANSPIKLCHLLYYYLFGPTITHVDNVNTLLRCVQSLTTGRIDTNILLSGHQ